MDERGMDLRLRHAPPWVLDAALGTVLTLALVLIIATNDNEAMPATTFSYGFAVGFGALMLLRRRIPRTVLTLSVLGVFAYYILDFPPIGVAVPILGALYSAAEAGLVVWSIGASIVVFATSMIFRMLDGVEPVGSLLGYDSVSNIALFAAAIALGFGVRSRRMQGLQQAEIIRLTEAQFNREAEFRIQMERERLSRELHDTVGHTMSVISLQAGVAAEAIGRDDQSATEAIERIRKASSQSLRELRSIVRILRSTKATAQATDSNTKTNTAQTDETRSIQSLSEVQHLVDAAKGAGIEVTTDISVTPADLSAPIDAAAYRVIQESITNTIRHAKASRVHVSVDLQNGELRIRVSDDGRGLATVDAQPGFGITGMRERVRLLGGTLTTRSGDGAGFTVEATLPARLS